MKRVIIETKKGKSEDELQETKTAISGVFTFVWKWSVRWQNPIRSTRVGKGGETGNQVIPAPNKHKPKSKKGL